MDGIAPRERPRFSWVDGANSALKGMKVEGARVRE